jgi:hypothetical protein
MSRSRSAPPHLSLRMYDYLSVSVNRLFEAGSASSRSVFVKAHFNGFLHRDVR